MKWSEAMEEAFQRWLVVDTFHSGHAIDTYRFYDFVTEVWRENRDIWNETEVEERIISFAKQKHPKFSVEHLEKFAEEERSKGTTILDFLSHLKEENELGLL